MTVTDKAWQSYIKKLSAINRKAAKIMQDWISVNGLDYPEELISYAYGIVGKYGEAAGALACEMYDTLARAQGKILPDAVPAEPATYSEVARAVIGTKKERPGQVPDTVARLVKQTAADTTLQNAKRDGAQFAWIPHGDTCSFCITLASRGWQYMSKNALKNGHAEHIHANCDCEYGVRFDGKSNVAGYDPDKYLEQYNNAEGTKPQDKINSMRREQYKINGDKIREQKREAYAARNFTIDGIPKSWNSLGQVSDDEILKGVNPNYQPTIPDYLVGTKDDYTTNCTNCVVAYSARKKGYNVTACSTGECGALRNGHQFFKAWLGRKPINASGSGLEEITNYVMNLDNDEFVAISVRKPKSIFSKSNGHALIAEKKNGQVVFLDPQRNRTYNNPKEIFDLVKEGDTYYMRIDDLELSDRGVSACKGVK